MRRIILFLAAVFMVVSIACGQSEPAASADTPTRVAAPAGFIPSTEAIDHIGEQATVCGPVKRGKYRKSGEGRPTFLNFDHTLYVVTEFIVVIWESDRGNFPTAPENHYENKQVCATGLIELGQEGKAVITAREASQLQIIR